MAQYFSGRYYKHQNEDFTICFIVGKAQSGEFVQVITNDWVRQFDSRKGFKVSRKGIRIKLPGIEGRVNYGKFAALKSDIMGPFRYLPMQCWHSVVSMSHTLDGEFLLDGKSVAMSGGKGYIEGDSGNSFPKEYLWIQSNAFGEDLSVMVSVADIPFAGFHFRGCICAILYRGREYRLATYKGVKICHSDNRCVILKQGKYRLRIDIEAPEFFPLKAPRMGNMTDVIQESNSAHARFRFWKRNELLFDDRSSHTSFECNLK